MATGTGLGGVVTALLPLVGIATILHARRKRKSGRQTPEDVAFAERQAATQETERRMAAYLAQRSAAGYQSDGTDTEQETTR